MNQIELNISREELEAQWSAMNRHLAQIHLAMCNSALGAVCGNQEARDQYVALRERAEKQEREMNMYGYALGELDMMAAQARMDAERNHRAQDTEEPAV